jgi:hypothetical protein
MAKKFSPEELIGRTFLITMISTGLYIAAVILFVR